MEDPHFNIEYRDEALRSLHHSYVMAKTKSVALSSKSNTDSFPKVNKKKAVKMYSAIATLLYSTLSISRVEELERYIKKNSSSLPRAVFDFDEWRDVIASAKDIRMKNRPLGVLPIDNNTMKTLSHDVQSLKKESTKQLQDFAKELKAMEAEFLKLSHRKGLGSPTSGGLSPPHGSGEFPRVISPSRRTHHSNQNQTTSNQNQNEEVERLHTYIANLEVLINNERIESKRILREEKQRTSQELEARYKIIGEQSEQIKNLETIHKTQSVSSQLEMDRLEKIHLKAIDTMKEQLDAEIHHHRGQIATIHATYGDKLQKLEDAKDKVITNLQEKLDKCEQLMKQQNEWRHVTGLEENQREKDLLTIEITDKLKKDLEVEYERKMDQLQLQHQKGLEEVLSSHAIEMAKLEQAFQEYKEQSSLQLASDRERSQSQMDNEITRSKEHVVIMEESLRAKFEASLLSLEQKLAVSDETIACLHETYGMKISHQQEKHEKERVVLEGKLLESKETIKKLETLAARTHEAFFNELQQLFASQISTNTSSNGYDQGDSDGHTNESGVLARIQEELYGMSQLHHISLERLDSSAREEKRLMEEDLRNLEEKCSELSTLISVRDRQIESLKAVHEAAMEALQQEHEAIIQEGRELLDTEIRRARGQLTAAEAAYSARYNQIKQNNVNLIEVFQKEVKRLEDALVEALAQPSSEGVDGVTNELMKKQQEEFNRKEKAYQDQLKQAQEQLDFEVSRWQELLDIEKMSHAVLTNNPRPEYDVMESSASFLSSSDVSEPKRRVSRMTFVDKAELDTLMAEREEQKGLLEVLKLQLAAVQESFEQVSDILPMAVAAGVGVGVDTDSLAREGEGVVTSDRSVSPEDRGDEQKGVVARVGGVEEGGGGHKGDNSNTKGSSESQPNPNELFDVEFTVRLLDYHLDTFGSGLQQAYCIHVAQWIEIPPAKVTILNIRAGSVILKTKVTGIPNKSHLAQFQADLSNGSFLINIQNKFGPAELMGETAVVTVPQKVNGKNDISLKKDKISSMKRLVESLHKAVSSLKADVMDAYMVCKSTNFITVTNKQYIEEAKTLDELVIAQEILTSVFISMLNDKDRQLSRWCEDGGAEETVSMLSDNSRSYGNVENAVAVRELELKLTEEKKLKLKLESELQELTKILSSYTFPTVRSMTNVTATSSATATTPLSKTTSMQPTVGSMTMDKQTNENNELERVNKAIDTLENHLVEALEYKKTVERDVKVLEESKTASSPATATGVIVGMVGNSGGEGKTGGSPQRVADLHRVNHVIDELRTQLVVSLEKKRLLEETVEVANTGNITSSGDPSAQPYQQQAQQQTQQVHQQQQQQSRHVSFGSPGSAPVPGVVVKDKEVSGPSVSGLMNQLAQSMEKLSILETKSDMSEQQLETEISDLRANIHTLETQIAQILESQHVKQQSMFVGVANNDSNTNNDANHTNYHGAEQFRLNGGEEEGVIQGRFDWLRDHIMLLQEENKVLTAQVEEFKLQFGTSLPSNEINFKLQDQVVELQNQVSLLTVAKIQLQQQVEVMENGRIADDARFKDELGRVEQWLLETKNQLEADIIDNESHYCREVSKYQAEISTLKCEILEIPSLKEELLWLRAENSMLKERLHVDVRNLNDEINQSQTQLTEIIEDRNRYRQGMAKLTRGISTTIRRFDSIRTENNALEEKKSEEHTPVRIHRRSTNSESIQREEVNYVDELSEQERVITNLEEALLRATMNKRDLEEKIAKKEEGKNEYAAAGGAGVGRSTVSGDGGSDGRNSDRNKSKDSQSEGDYGLELAALNDLIRDLKSRLLLQIQHETLFQLPPSSATANAANAANAAATAGVDDSGNGTIDGSLFPDSGSMGGSRSLVESSQISSLMRELTDLRRELVRRMSSKKMMTGAQGLEGIAEGTKVQVRDETVTISKEGAMAVTDPKVTDPNQNPAKSTEGGADPTHIPTGTAAGRVSGPITDELVVEKNVAVAVDVPSAESPGQSKDEDLVKLYSKVKDLEEKLTVVINSISSEKRYSEISFTQVGGNSRNSSSVLPTPMEMLETNLADLDRLRETYTKDLVVKEEKISTLQRDLDKADDVIKELGTKLETLSKERHRLEQNLETLKQEGLTVTMDLESQLEISNEAKKKLELALADLQLKTQHQLHQSEGESAAKDVLLSTGKKEGSEIGQQQYETQKLNEEILTLRNQIQEEIQTRKQLEEDDEYWMKELKKSQARDKERCVLLDKQVDELNLEVKFLKSKLDKVVKKEKQTIESLNQDLAATTIQSRVRGVLTRKKNAGQLNYPPVKNPGQLVPAYLTREGESGWYLKDGALYYFYVDEGNYYPLCGPITKKDYALANETDTNLRSTATEGAANASDSTGSILFPIDRVTLIATRDQIEGLIQNQKKLWKSIEHVRKQVEKDFQTTRSRYEAEIKSLRDRLVHESFSGSATPRDDSSDGQLLTPRRSTRQSAVATAMLLQNSVRGYFSGLSRFQNTSKVHISRQDDDL